jgi:hypothetical protein
MFNYVFGHNEKNIINGHKICESLLSMSETWFVNVNMASI